MKITLDINSVKIPKNHLDVLKSFCAFCYEKLKCKNDIKIVLLPKEHNVNGISTAAYDKTSDLIYARYGERALVDVLRSIAHELTHAKQNEDGKLEKPTPDIGGPIEDDANAYAGRFIKMFVKENDIKDLYKM